METKRVMRIIDRDTCLMECIVCGERHWPTINEGGRFKRGSWHCPNGCIFDREKQLKEWDKTFKECERWRKKHSNKPPHFSSENPEEKRLGIWIAEQCEALRINNLRRMGIYS